MFPNSGDRKEVRGEGGQTEEVEMADERQKDFWLKGSLTSRACIMWYIFLSEGLLKQLTFSLVAMSRKEFEKQGKQHSKHRFPRPRDQSVEVGVNLQVGSYIMMSRQSKTRQKGKR